MKNDNVQERHLCDADPAGRAAMVRNQLEARGIRDPRVIAAMLRVPRAQFVPEAFRIYAYEDRPLPIGFEQTISQPFMVATMLEALALKGEEKVLEVGAGSGYASALLAELAMDVFAIERIGELAQSTRRNLALAGYDRVRLRHGDGSQGWEEEAPFDAILVSAAAPQLPKRLLRQLAVGGVLIAPVGRDGGVQKLVRVVRTGENSFEEEDIGGVQFVPLIGGVDGNAVPND